MALSILDGTQTATTLSTILSSGQHITAHTVVSLGTQAITDILNATSAGLTNTQLRASAVTIGGTVTVGNSLTISSLPAISGTVTANLFAYDAPNDQDRKLQIAEAGIGLIIAGSTNGNDNPVIISGTVTIGSALPAGTNRIGVVTIGAGTVTIGAGTAQIGSVTASISGTVPISISSVTVGNSLTISSLPAISGTVTVGNTVSFISVAGDDELTANISNAIQGSALPAGTNRIGVVTIGAGTVTIGAGTAQIGSVTASISGTVPVSGTFFQGTQPVSLATLPTLAAGTAQIGSVTASISGTVPISISSVTVGNSLTISSLPAVSGTVTANVFGTNGAAQIPLQMASDDEAFTNGNRLAVSIVNNEGQEYTTPLPISGTVTANTFAVQGTAVTTSNFTSTTASTVLANYNATREVLTIFNEGAGNLHIAPGATCTTISYQVRLSAGDYYEVPNHQTTITHSAVFATAGTARICQLS